MNEQKTMIQTAGTVSPEENVMPARKAYGFSWLLAFIYGAVTLLVSSIALFLVRRLVPDLPAKELDWPVWLFILVNMAPQYLAALPVCLLLSRICPGQKPEQHKMKPLQLILAVPCAFTLMYAGNLIGTIITTVLGLATGVKFSNETIQELLFNDNGIFFAAIAVLAAPVAEELLFRKLLIDRVKKYGSGLAIVTSGLMFGLFHGNLTQFFYAAIIGCFFAFVYVRTGKIIYTMFLHMCVNTLGGLLPLLVLGDLDLSSLSKRLMAGDVTALSPRLMIYSACIYGLMILGVVILVMKKKQFRIDPPEAPVPKSKRAAVVMLNIGFLLLFAFCITETVRVIIQQTKALR